MTRILPPRSSLRSTSLGLGSLLAVFAALLLAVSAEEIQVKSSVYSLSTAVVYNTSTPGSKELAEFYAKARGIPSANIVALTCPDRETITRAEFEETIVAPLREVFVGNRWWKVSLSPGEKIRVTSNRIHIMALMYGMPLRISNNVPAPQVEIDPETGKPKRRQPNLDDTSACSVDSELTMLAKYETPSRGALKNPYFNRTLNFYQAPAPELILVGRIDGPTQEIARRLIIDAIATERTGLWGVSYVDLAQKMKMGDEWLKKSLDLFGREGIPYVVDIHKNRFPKNYPMRNASLYFGWYSHDADGPFLNPDFRFNRGAVACHIFSFSAKTLRSTTDAWAGPLLDRGAAAVLGNVFEPYLHLTHHLDVFNDRLLNGFTFIESAYMAAPALSWMAVAVGDPLYRPFESIIRLDSESYRKDGNADLKAFRLASKRWGREDVRVLKKQLTRAGETLQSGTIFESLALAAGRRENYAEARILLDKASNQFKDAPDKLRVRLHEVDLLRAQGKRGEAVSLLAALRVQFGQSPEAAAIDEVLQELNPPPPPFPEPPGTAP